MRQINLYFQFFLNADQPSFIRLPENVEADDQSEVTLSCEVTSNPIPDIVWVFDPIDRVSFKSHLYFLQFIEFLVYPRIICNQVWWELQVNLK